LGGANRSSSCFCECTRNGVVHMKLK
jgi:hypothetical protein